MPVVRPYNLPEQEARPIPAVYPQTPAASDLGTFGGNQARDLQQAGANLERASDTTFSMFERVAKEANDTRVQDLTNQYVLEQQKILFSNPNSFYRQRGDAAIKAAEPTTEALQKLRTGFLDQAANSAQRDALGHRLDLHMVDASAGMSRHVATQSLVWQDTVAKGTIQAASNAAVQNANDPKAVTIHADGAWATEYERQIKITGDTPEGKVAAKASADAVRSGILKAAIETQAVTDPAMAQRTLDENRGKLDAADIPVLSRQIKASSDKRKAQDIGYLVTATGGISPNYNARTQAAEGGATYTENKIGALGKYQMVPGTYTDLAQETEWGKGKTQAEVRALLLEPKAGEGRQEELKRLYDDRSLKKLTEAGIPVNDMTLYATHFLGHGAGPAILKLPDDTPLNQAMVTAHTLPGIKDPKAYADQVYANNPFLAKVQTVGDFKVLMAQKIGAPLTLASSGSPEKPNLDAMLQNGLAMAGSDPDLRDLVTQTIKNQYATRHALYTAQVGVLERKAYAHIDAGGTVETLPPEIKGALDSDSLLKVNQYEEKRIAKKRTENNEAASKRLTDLEEKGQLTRSDVIKERDNMTAAEYRSRLKIADGEDRLEDPASGEHERLQREIGSRDMRQEIFASHAAGEISTATRNSLLAKNDIFTKENRAPSAYKTAHDTIRNRLDPGIVGAGISRDIWGRAISELDQYVAANPQGKEETEPQVRKRFQDFAEDTIKRYQLLSTEEMTLGTAVPVHAPLKRSDMTNLPKAQSHEKLVESARELARKFAAQEITEEQYQRDALTIKRWKEIVNARQDPPVQAPRR